MREIELKPCPFCGEVPMMDMYEGFYADNYYIICRNSDCEMNEVYTGMDKSPEVVAKKWNKRVSKGEQE